jgi:hypothetical protein
MVLQGKAVMGSMVAVSGILSTMAGGNARHPQDDEHGHVEVPWQVFNIQSAII